MRGITNNIWLNGSGGVNSAEITKMPKIEYRLLSASVLWSITPSFLNIIDTIGNWKINPPTKIIQMT